MGFDLVPTDFVSCLEKIQPLKTIYSFLIVYLSYS